MPLAWFRLITIRVSDTHSYRGAWLDEQGRQQLPVGFSVYLPTAGFVAFVLPVLALATLALAGNALAGCRLLAGYLATFAVQALLETRLFHRNPMSPAIPFTFGPWRFWQLGRSLWLARSSSHPPWAAAFLWLLVAFWVLDFAVTAALLPWTYNWHLQLERAGGKEATSGGVGGSAATEAKEE